MGKPKAPSPPDYAAAAKEQGAANVDAALATNYLNQQNQVGPDGSISYSYGTKDNGQGYYLPNGTFIPQATVTTTLSPAQQKLYDQTQQINEALNSTAIKGLGYADQVMNSPLDIDGKLGALPTADTYGADRQRVEDALLQRLQPYLDKDRAAMENKLANQGITLGSEAYGADQDIFNRNTNDARLAAIAQAGQEQQRLFNMGLASRQQGIQEMDYARNAPINIINALRSGNQVSMPQFQNTAAGSQIQAAPIYAATNDAYQAAMQNYQTKMQGFGSLVGGLGSLGGAAIKQWG